MNDQDALEIELGDRSEPRPATTVPIPMIRAVPLQNQNAIEKAAAKK
jgi:hypothetical protein